LRGRKEGYRWEAALDEEGGCGWLLEEELGLLTRHRKWSETNEACTRTNERMQSTIDGPETMEVTLPRNDTGAILTGKKGAQ
jgi:hypothetical protein